MMLNQIQNPGGAQPGLETNYNREKRYSKVFTKVDKFDGEWKDWGFTFKSAVRSSNHDAFDLLNWAEKEETEIIDVDARAPNNIRDASDLDSALFNQIAMLMKGESMQIMHNSNFSGTEAWRRLTKRYSPTTPVRGLQLMMSVVSPQKITKGNKVLEMIERWETKILALERDFNERFSERMKAGVLLNMMSGDLQNSLIQQADELENFKMAKEKVVSIMESKNALQTPWTPTTSTMRVVTTLIRMTERRKILAQFTEIRCATVVVARATSPGIAARLIPEARARERAKARTARVALNNKPRGVPGTPSFASTATRKDTLRRSAGRRNVRRTVTGRRTMLTRMLAT